MSVEDDHSDDDALAAEYVLHLLDADARRAFEARLAQDQALRDLVEAWENRLAPLAEDVAPVAPPASVKARVEGRLFTEKAPARGPLWRLFAGGAVALAVVAGAVVLSPVLFAPQAEGPALTARVAAEDGSLVLAASFAEEAGVLSVERRAGAARPGRVLELWLIAEGADAPVSLGVLPEASTAEIAVSAELAGRLTGGILAISDEPPGGSPTGAPTGDVLATGAVTEA